ncbi:MAG TPA: hypothetical protein VFS20_25415 [Longimicrobium sp.]|nr:hypothetical protein [Longimicrobium sp.]
MRKLKLEVQNLRIESFDTAPAPSAKGTVEAYATNLSATDPCYTCGDTTCIGTHDGNVCTYNFTCNCQTRPRLTQDSCPCYPEV